MARLSHDLEKRLYIETVFNRFDSDYTSIVSQTALIPAHIP